MADTHNLSTDAVVRKVLSEDHADLIREAVALLCHQIMEAEVSAQITGAGLTRVICERNTIPPCCTPRTVENRMAKRLLRMLRTRPTWSGWTEWLAVRH